ncbi:MAG: aminopeptidase, partial [Clostridia bacterium]|nr:aminopeptidase [Clostridia bacterium]
MDLTYKKTFAYKAADGEKMKKVFDYCENYKKFLNDGKTEREVVKETIDLLDSNGYKPYALGEKINAGDKLFYDNRGKGLYIIRAGKKDVAKCGIKILVAHVDSPRLDIKQNPLYEDGDANIAFFKTHYYGGIKKYQWLTIPLALHGVIALKSGEVISVKIGEEDSDPVFYITDLLPHLSHEDDAKTVAKAFQAESLNIVLGGIPLGGEDEKAVKKNVLKILNEAYGITEEDFLSAELEAVPAVKARDVGFDRAFISSYGHDDRVCAYPEVTATLSAETDETVLTILADKEEIGSEGPTGMKCRLIGDLIDIIAESYGASSAVVRAKSKCISADVTAA